MEKLYYILNNEENAIYRDILMIFNVVMGFPVGQTDGHSSIELNRILEYIKNIYTFWNLARLLTPVTYIYTKLVYSFWPRSKGIQILFINRIYACKLYINIDDNILRLLIYLLTFIHFSSCNFSQCITALIDSLSLSVWHVVFYNFAL